MPTPICPNHSLARTTHKQPAICKSFWIVWIGDYAGWVTVAFSFSLGLVHICRLFWWYSQCNIITGKHCIQHVLWFNVSLSSCPAAVVQKSWWCVFSPKNWLVVNNSLMQLLRRKSPIRSGGMQALNIIHPFASLLWKLIPSVLLQFFPLIWFDFFAWTQFYFRLGTVTFRKLSVKSYWDSLSLRVWMIKWILG